MVNKVILIGNLGADPETRNTSGGTIVSNMRVATNERIKEGDNWVDHTEWHRVACFGRTAENVAKYMKKGKTVYIEGKLRTRKWQNKEGHDQYSTEIIADTVRFLGGRDGAGAGGSREHDEPSNGRDEGRGGGGGGNQGGGGGGGGADDDIPF